MTRNHSVSLCDTRQMKTSASVMQATNCCTTIRSEPRSVWCRHQLIRHRLPVDQRDRAQCSKQCKQSNGESQMDLPVSGEWPGVGDACQLTDRVLLAANRSVGPHSRGDSIVWFCKGNGQTISSEQRRLTQPCALGPIDQALMDGPVRALCWRQDDCHLASALRASTVQFTLIK